MIGTGSMSDPYMHCEEELRLTRRCLEIIRQYGFGATVLTKSDRVLRDLDLLEAIQAQAKCVVQMPLTTWDPQLCGILEPRVCSTQRRVEVLKELQRHGIPTLVWMTPILPFLNDNEENIRPILEACADAGVKGVLCFGMGMTLRDGNREYYYAALDRHFPGLSEKYRQTYGRAYELLSPRHKELTALFHAFCTEHGMLHTPDDCFSYLAEFPAREEQMRLF
jgi:DNA repair photolyase